MKASLPAARLHRQVARLLLIPLLCLGLTACAERQARLEPEPQIPGQVQKAKEPPAQVQARPVAEAEKDKAALAWRNFVSKTANAAFLSGPFRISANLRYSDPAGKNERVSCLLWGNGKADTPYPLRLDLLAGAGVVAAKVREDGENFLAVVPEEKAAYTRAGGSRALVSFGVPIPMTLSDLTLLLTGRPDALFLPRADLSGRAVLPVGSPGEDGRRVEAVAAAVPGERESSGNGARFVINEARLPGILELSEAGVPLAWSERGGKGWSVAIEPSAEKPFFPQKLRISHPAGYSALIVVRDVSRVSPPYTSAQLDLILPPGTVEKKLEDEEALSGGYAPAESPPETVKKTPRGGAKKSTGKKPAGKATVKVPAKKAAGGKASATNKTRGKK